jgi:hypothetical protein
MRCFLSSIGFLLAFTAWFCLPVSNMTFGQTSSLACDECTVDGFYIPSLQTLVMIPLSRAGDRLEAALTKKSPIRKGDCDQRIGQPGVEPPSYALDQDVDQDIRVACELAPPVKLAPNKLATTSSVGDTSGDPALKETAVRLASSTESRKGVRLTGVTEPHSASGESIHRLGYLKDKYLQRRRIDSSATESSNQIR